MSTIVSDLTSLLAAGILRLRANSARILPESVAACLEVLPPAPLSVTSPRVNGAETPHDERSGT